jgi:hypothetical protein
VILVAGSKSPQIDAEVMALRKELKSLIDIGVDEVDPA